jgi:hypothetical protein
VNQDALHDVTCARNVTKNLIASYRDQDSVRQAMIQKIIPTITPPTLSSVRIFHAIADICVLGALWALTLYKEKENEAGE